MVRIGNVTKNGRITSPKQILEPTGFERDHVCQQEARSRQSTVADRAYPKTAGLLLYSVKARP